MCLRSRIDSCNETLAFFNRQIAKGHIKLQSGIADSAQQQGLITTLKQDENFKETAGVDIKMVDQGDSKYSDQGQRGVLDMHDYLSRPVSIYSSALSLSTDISIRISPWDLFSKVPAVRAKFRNFAFIKGNLHIRISVSGTPFHYGRLLCSYQPLANYNKCITYYTSTLSSYPTDFRSMYLNYLSQARGSTVINCNANDPIEMICPFISAKPMFRLFNDASGSISDTASLTDFQDAGDLMIYSINQIKSVSASPSNVFMQVYAWMEDVEIGTNTASQMVITTESGTADEREVGPVEKFCTGAANLSGTISFIPEIAPYAKASSIVFTFLGKVASWLGWSKPVLIDKPVYVRPEPYINGALTIGYDTAHRIVLDPKQELHVDPRLCGTSKDELILSEIANRCTYINTFTWAHTSAALGAPIWISNVTPNMGTYFHDVTGSHYFMQPSAMAFACGPFTYWRGDIVYRFEIVASSFHRGKLGIYFEPNVAQEAVITTSTFLNKQSIKVVDIQQTQVFEVVVNWSSYRAWLLVNGTTALYYLSDPANVYSTAGYTNGFIAVFPFTDLQSPDNSDVSVNVYAYCPNLQLNGLTDLNLPSQRILTESGDADGYEDTCSCIQNVEMSRIVLNDSTASTFRICEDHFGEQPLSFRTLLKRYVGQQTLNNVSGTGATLTITTQILPVNNLTVNSTSTYQQFSMDLFSYLRYAYLGIRGSIRMRLSSRTTNSLTNLNWIKVGFAQPANAFSNTSTTSSSPINVATLNGSTTFVPTTNGGIEVEFPYYSNNLFQYCFSDTYDDANALADNMSQLWFRNMNCTFDNPGDSFAAVPFRIERAAGEDFNLMRFCGAPPYNN